MQWRLLRLDWKYAIGELFIVTAGVLIALYVEQWNSDRIDRAEEAEIVSRLILDLQSDLNNIETGKSIVEGKLPAIQRLILISESDDITLGQSSDLITDIQSSALWGWNQVVERPTTYNELLGSGRFNLILDSRIRDDISAYYRSMENSNRRVDERETEYPGLTYRLAPAPGNTRMLTELQINDLVGRLRQDTVRELLLAEENFGVFAKRTLESQKQYNLMLTSSLSEYLSSISER